MSTQRKATGASKNNTEQQPGIKEKCSTEEIRNMAMENGMRTLRMDGVDKVFQGITDIDEIIRVCWWSLTC